MHPRLLRTPITLPILPLAFSILGIGCATTAPKPVPLLPPPLDIGIRHFAGTVLSGRQPDATLADKITDAASLPVHCRVTYLRALRTGDLPAIATRTRLVVAGRSGEPLSPITEAVTGGGIGRGVPARSLIAGLTAVDADYTVLTDLRGLLHPGMTAAVRANHRLAPDESAGTGVGSRRNMQILVSIEPGATKPDVALQFDDVVAPSAQSPSGYVSRRQIVLLEDSPQVDDESLVLVLPSPYFADQGRALLVEISVTRELDAATQQELMTRCRRDLRHEDAAARAERAEFDASEARQVTLATSLQALEFARHQRASLVFLAQSTGAALALDLALCGDEATLAAWVQAVGPQAQSEPQPEKVAAVGWLIERTAFELLAKRLDDGELTPELAGVLAQHAGEVGRFPGAVHDVLRRAAGLSEMKAILKDENLAFLESAEPGARLRAFDWLARRDAAPMGYSPLAPRKERRIALARAEATAEIAATAAAAQATETGTAEASGKPKDEASTAPAGRKDGDK